LLSCAWVTEESFANDLSLCMHHILTRPTSFGSFRCVPRTMRFLRPYDPNDTMTQFVPKCLQPFAFNLSYSLRPDDSMTRRLNDAVCYLMFNLLPFTLRLSFLPRLTSYSFVRSTEGRRGGHPLILEPFVYQPSVG